MMKPRMCHLNYQPVTTLKSRSFDFDLFELEKINFSVKMEHMAEQLNKQLEITTPTFKTNINQNQGAVKEIGNYIQHIKSISPKKLIKSKRNSHVLRKAPLRNPEI
ncbi:unnamed protein product [Paramecium primaurelia]|uniref:Uncharacterized protein n=1 Tax=Paramecium primaurelia TaxID=5886 RepID=A0A8S1LZY2_PARPR|nr:unnamed protein product [Paramecium primaurelia]